MEYLLHIGIMLCIYTILVLSTNLTVGLANLLSLCQAAFYGVGAYLGTFMLLNFNLPFLIIASTIMLANGILSLIISYASVRLKGDYFILATLGFQMIVFTLLTNWTAVTRGPYGISGIPAIKILVIWSLNGLWIWFLFALVFTVLVALFFSGLQKSPYGRLLKAISTDELSAQALGHNTAFLKASAFFISAAFASMAGIIYASYIRYIDPTSFTLNESIFILTALFIGGTGKRIWGPLSGAALVVILPEILRFVGLPDLLSANIRQIIYGVVLIVLMFYRPQGLVGDAQIK